MGVNCPRSIAPIFSRIALSQEQYSPCARFFGRQDHGANLQSKAPGAALQSDGFNNIEDNGVGQTGPPLLQPNRNSPMECPLHSRAERFFCCGKSFVALHRPATRAYAHQEFDIRALMRPWRPSITYRVPTGNRLEDQLLY